MALVLERDQCQGEPLGAHRIRHVEGLPRWHDVILQTLQDQHGGVETVEPGDRERSR